MKDKLKLLILGLLFIQLTIQTNEFNTDCPNPDIQVDDGEYKLPLPNYNDILAMEFENDIPFNINQFKGELWFKFPIEHKKFIKKLIMIDETTLLTIGDDKKIILWDLFNQQLNKKFENIHKDMNTAIMFNMNYLITASKVLKVFKIQNESPMEYELVSLQQLPPLDDEVQQIIQYDKNSIITVTIGNEVRHWIFDSEKEKFNQNEEFLEIYIEQQNNYCTDARITRDRKYLVTTNFGKQINIIDMETQEHFNIINTEREIYENTILILKQQQNIVVTGTWRTIGFWDIQSGKKISDVHSVHYDWIQEIVQLDDDHILTISDDKEGHIWKLKFEYEQEQSQNTCENSQNEENTCEKQNQEKNAESESPGLQFPKVNNIKSIDLEFVKSLKGNTYAVINAIVGSNNTIITGSADANILVYH